jgi:hypothetical protein
MRCAESNLLLNRRGIFLRAIAGSGLLTFSGWPLFGASDFWNKKPVSDWSLAEVEQLRTKSPWAKKVRSQLTDARAERMDRAGSGKPALGGMTGADSNGISIGGKSRGGSNSSALGSPSPGSANQSPEVVVCWQSAMPLLEATKLELPEQFANHYAVSVAGIPLSTLAKALNGGGDAPEDPAARQKAVVDRLLAGTMLTVKGRLPVAADLLVQSQDKQSLIFAFLKPSLALTQNDKEVDFEMSLRTIKINAKFELKEMVYKGLLAL